MKKLIGFAVMVVVTIICVIWMNIIEKEIAALPRIENYLDFKQAIEGEPQTYIIIKAPISGKDFNDYDGMFYDDVIYAKSTEEEYVRHSDDEGTEYRWEEQHTFYYQCRDYFLYEAYPVDFGDAEFNGIYAPEALQEPYDSYYGSGYYWPYGGGEYVGNIRCKISVMYQGSEASFPAVVGDGKVIMSNHNGRGNGAIEVGGDETDIADTDSLVPSLILFFGWIGWIAWCIVSLFTK